MFFRIRNQTEFTKDVTMSDDEREEKELDLTSPEVVTKYKSAAEIVNSVFHSLISHFFWLNSKRVFVFGYIGFITLMGYR